MPVPCQCHDSAMPVPCQCHASAMTCHDSAMPVPLAKNRSRVAAVHGGGFQRSRLLNETEAAVGALHSPRRAHPTAPVRARGCRFA
eukprot:402447-Pyramimonas_sp.AAC.1